VTQIDFVLDLLDCPQCRQNRGLIGQRDDAAEYLACPQCEFWYPIRQEVFVLLPPDRVEGGFRRSLGPKVSPSVRRRARKALDAKSIIYSYYARMSELCAKFEVRDRDWVVDVGCSTGSLCSALRSEQGYFGLDISLRSVAFARRSTGEIYAQADAERLPLKTGSVPFFVSREVLEHLRDPLAGASELRRVGRRGVVETPNLDYPFLYDPLNYVLIRRGKRAKFGIYGYDHRELYDIAGWRDILARAGFLVGRESAIGTGLALNGSDMVWHALLSWREFDSLPRNGVHPQIAHRLFKVYDAAHRLDKRLYPRGCSQAYEVSAEHF
jgi:uncharacterized protein YbaR (Trm112 family)